MKIIKIFGIVVAVHAAAFLFVFAIPGCRSAAKKTAATPAPVAGTTETTSPIGGSSPVESTQSAPTTSTDAGSPSVAFKSPTRPGTAEAALLQAAPTPDVQPATTHTVAKGDSLWTIARKNGVSVKELTAANNLRSDSTLKLGQKLVIPGKVPAATANGTSAAASTNASYTVRSGDTIAQIARRSGTTAGAIKALNGLSTDNLKVGQTLVLPGASTAGATPAALSNAPVAASSSASVHTIKAGETLSVIARKYGVKVGELAAANNIADPTKIRVGQELKVPGKAGVSTPSAPAPAPVAEPEPVAPTPSAPPAFNPSPFTTPSPFTSDPMNPIESSASPISTVPAGTPVVPVVEQNGAPRID